MYDIIAKRIFIKIGLPLHLTFFVTNKCNYNCTHCFYWKRKYGKELGLDEICMIAQNMGEILWLQITGGEPFLRKDIDRIVEIFYMHNKSRFISISTNGSLTKIIKNKTEKILGRCKDSLIRISISLDGLRSVHDHIREKGSFDKVLKTIKELKILKTKYKNLNISIVMTYSNFNQGSIIEAYKEIKKLGVDSINVNLVRGRTRNKKAKEVYIKDYELLNSELVRNKSLAYSGFRFADLISAQEIMKKNLIKETYVKKKRVVPCYAGNLSAILYENGDVFPCEMLDKKIGDVKQYNYDFRMLWNSKKAVMIRKKIKNGECYCTNECNMLVNILFNIRNYPKIFQEVVKLKK